MFLNSDIKSKFLNLIEEKSLERDVTIIFSTITIFILYIIDIYNNFYYYESFLQNFLQNNIFVDIGLIGVLVSALAITLGTFSVNDIKKLNIILNTDKNQLNTLIGDYIFIAVIIGFIVSFKVIGLILLTSQLPLIQNEILFYFVLYIYNICFFFVIFSLVSIVNHTYDIFIIVQYIADYNDYEIEVLEEYNKTLSDVENKVQNLINSSGVNISHEKYIDMIKEEIKLNHSKIEKELVKQLEKKYKFTDPVYYKK